jgi:serine/threonine protein kinase
MNYQQNTHCQNCFEPNQNAVCPHCHFNREDDIRHIHHLPLFTRLDKGYVIGRVLGEGGFAIVYAALREVDGLAFAVKESSRILSQSRLE